MKYFFVLLAMCCTRNVMGQGIVKGIVHEPAGKPVAYATVSLLQARDSALVSRKLTAENGWFVIDQVSPGRYLILVSYTGFNNTYSQPFDAGSNADTADMGILKLEPKTGTLKEVLVTGRRPVIERRADRYVMDVENSALAGGSSVQLLKTAPFVSVSPSKDITLQGKKTMILIDNKPVPDLALQDVLQSLPAGEIIRIEFITEPSAKYDAAFGAVINIVTKRSQTVGLTGSAWADGSWGKFGIVSTGVRLTYKHNNLTLYGRVGYQRFNEWYRDGGPRMLLLKGEERVLNDSTIRLYESDIYSFQTGGELVINKHQVLGAEINGNIRRSPGSFQTATRFSRVGGEPDSTLYTPGTFRNKGSTINYNLNYRAKMAGGKGDWTTLLTFTSFSRDLQQYFTPFLTDQLGNVVRYPDPYRTFNPANVDILIGQSDYTHTFNKQWKLEGGIKYQYTRTQNEVLQERLLNNQYVKDENTSSNILLNENIVAAYAIGSKRWKKYFVQASLRMENTRADANGYFSKNYTDFFPNLLVQRTFSTGFQMSLAYRRQIIRPPYQEVLPYTVIFDQYTIVQGNPSLNPGYADLITLNSTIKKLNIAVSYRFNKGLFVRLPARQDTLGVTWYSLQNLDKTNTWTANVFYPLTITQWWTANNNASVSYSKSNGRVLSGTYDLALWSGNVRTNHIFQFTDVVRLEVNYYWVSVTNNGLTKTDGYTNMDAGLMIQVLKKRGQVRLGGEELFKRNVYYAYQEFGSFRKNSIAASDSRRVTLSFRLNFGKTKVSAPNKRLGNEDAIQRIR